MPLLSANDHAKRNNARIIYSSFIINQQDLTDRVTVRSLKLLPSDLAIKNLGARFTTYEEKEAILYKAPIFSLIVSGNKSVSGSTTGLAQISFSGITDTGSAPSGMLDDAFIPIPMGGMAFNFFGTNYSNSITWSSNNAFIFGSTFTPHRVSISATTARAILIGNYDRMCTSIYYSNNISNSYSITTLLISFTNYYTDSGTTTYTYQIRLIKETTGEQRQFIEVCVITSPPSPGYSSNLAVTYPSGNHISGLPQDSDGLVIDPTKASPYNITNGTAFLNPCGSTFSTASPSAGTSFIFSSDSSGTNWLFTNNSYVNV
jgi:hypothetical protein